jgi:lycopene cyclase CruA
MEKTKITTKFAADSGEMQEKTKPVAQAVLPEAQLSHEELAELLKSRYPLTVENFRKMEGGLANLTYVMAVQSRWRKVAKGELPVEGEIIRRVPTLNELPPTLADFDLVYAGGVLGLFSAAVMARMGYKVLVFDQRQVGTSHREWNISDDELGQFVESGLFSRQELEQAVANRYKTGLVKFYSGNIPEPGYDLYLDQVLDVAIDLGTLLKMTRAKFEQAGGTILDYRALKKVYVTEKESVRSVVEVESEDGKLECYGAHLTVNALGSISPLSLVMQGGKPFDGVCPTVGTTATNFKFGRGELEVHPEHGDVLLTVAHAQKGRQLIWEGFPGKHGEMTTYLFYYDLVSPEQAEAQDLLDLFEQYFELLPTYKLPGENFEHIRPVYGYIPARHHRTRAGSACTRGILSVGDATSPQSALTFCGFGSQVRNLPRLTKLLDYALRNNLLEEKHLRQIGAHQVNINLVWVFSRFMQPFNAKKHPDSVNRMLNVFCAALDKVGKPVTRRFFQDKMTWRDYILIMLTTAMRYPKVYLLTLKVLGWKGIGNWAGDLINFSTQALLCSVYKATGKGFRAKLERFLAKRNPQGAFRFLAKREEWKSSGWLFE